MDKLYEEHILKSRNIYIYNKVRDEGALLFILQDGDMLKNIENNIIKKIDDNLDNLMLVAIEPLDRFKEYTPWFEESQVERIDIFEGYGDEYLDFIRRDLLDFLREKYGLSFKAENTYMAGASLGGLISTYGLAKYPQSFGGGIFVSSSYWYGGFLNYLKLADFPRKDLKIYMDVGDREKPGKITLFKDIIEETNKVYRIFLDKGIKKENINYKIQENMGHNLSFFIDRIYDGIYWIWQKENQG